MTDLLNIQVAGDTTLNTVLENKPFLINIEGSIQICMTLCGQTIEGCTQTELVTMKNSNSILILEPKPNTTQKCNIQLAFDSNTESSTMGKYSLEKIFISTPSLHRINKMIYDMEAFLLYSSTQKDGTKLYVCMCSFFTGVDSIQPHDWRFTSYTLMNELFGNPDKIPTANQTLGIGAPPNPIDVSSFLPREGFRNFYEYTHPMNTKVNFRVFSSPLYVSKNVIQNIQNKLFTGTGYVNFKQMIQTSTNPNNGLFIFFSQDMTKSIDSALNGQLTNPQLSQCPPTQVPKEVKQQVAEVKQQVQEVKQQVKTNQPTTQKKQTKKSTSKKTKSKSKKRKEKFSNSTDSDDEEDENMSDDEVDEEDTEDFENEEEDDEEEDEDFENEEEVDEDEDEEDEDFKNKKASKSLKGGATFASVFVFFIVFLPSIWFILSRIGYSNNTRVGGSIFMFILSCILAWLTYIGIISSETDESVEKARKQADKKSKKLPKDEKKRKENLKKSKRARTAMLFTLGSFIIIPYFIYILTSKILNDPTFEGLGNFQFDSNKVLKLLNTREFQNVMRYKLWYLVILFVQVILTVVVSIMLMLNQGIGSAVRIIPFLIIIFLCSFGFIYKYFSSRSQLSFQDPTVSELDYYSVFSMGLSAKNIMKLLGFKDIDIIESTNVSFNGMNPEPSAPPMGMQQGGTNITETERIPGLSNKNLQKSIEKTMSQIDGMKQGDFNFIYENLASQYYLIAIGLVLFILIICILSSTTLIQNNTKELDTTWSTFGAISGLILSFVVMGIMYSKIMIVSGKGLNTSPMNQNKLDMLRFKSSGEELTNNEENQSLRNDEKLESYTSKITSAQTEINNIKTQLSRDPTNPELLEQLRNAQFKKGRYVALKNRLQSKPTILQTLLGQQPKPYSPTLELISPSSRNPVSRIPPLQNGETETPNQSETEPNHGIELTSLGGINPSRIPRPSRTRPIHDEEFNESTTQTNSSFGRRARGILGTQVVNPMQSTR
jgi:carbonic anhydrase